MWTWKMRSGERIDEHHRVDELVDQVARVEVEAERRMMADGLERSGRRNDVVGDLGRMHLQTEAHAFTLEGAHDRQPAVGEVPVAGVDVVLGRRRKEIELRPDAAAGEAVDDIDTEELGRVRCVHDLLSGALPNPLGIAVAPNARRQDALVALVDRVAHALTDQVGADRRAAQAVLLQQVPLGADVGVILECLVDLEVIAPAG